MTKKILFYCQYLQGVGHLTRSKNICLELSKHFETTLICGGPKIEQIEKGVAIKYISPFLMEPESKELYVPESNQTVEETWKERESQLAKLAQDHYDFLIVEYFPFGRYKFKNEILKFITNLKAKNSSLKVVLSLRDIVLEREDKVGRREKIVNILNQYFDLVLYHSDSQFFTIDQFYPEIQKQIKIPIEYTGFVTEPQGPLQNKREKTILISNGGGSVGDEIFEFSFKQIEKYPQYIFKYIISPYLPEQLRERILKLADRFQNISVIDFSSQYEQELSKCSLSLSTAGYNTLLNHVVTNTPAIMWPYLDNAEQSLRVALFSKRCSIWDATKESNLDELFERALKSNAPKQALEINLEGALNTAKILKKL